MYRENENERERQEERKRGIQNKRGEKRGLGVAELTTSRSRGIRQRTPALIRSAPGRQGSRSSPWIPRVGNQLERETETEAETDGENFSSPVEEERQNNKNFHLHFETDI